MFIPWNFPLQFFRSPSDGDLMIPPWTFCDGFGEAISVLFCKKK